MSGGVLVAGVGNIFLGDDGFGVEVAQRLRWRPARDGGQWANVATAATRLVCKTEAVVTPSLTFMFAAPDCAAFADADACWAAS